MIVDMGDNTVTAYGFTQKIVLSERSHCSIQLRMFSVHDHDDICLCSDSNVYLQTFEKDPDVRRKAIKLHKQFGHPRVQWMVEQLKKRQHQHVFASFLGALA